MHVLGFFAAWVFLLLLATAVLYVVGQYLRPKAQAGHQRAARAAAHSSLHL